MSYKDYVVRTTMGSTHLRTNTEVYVSTSPTTYVKKRVNDINPGELVLYSKPFTSTTLEHVEPHLPRSPRYDYAKNLLHEKNEKGEYVPKLRSLLIRGLAQKGVISRENLESKLFRDNDCDFTPQEYRVMERQIEEIISDNEEVSIGSSGIRKWLNGETLGPRNWGVFRTLGDRLNPSFKDFKEDDQDNKGYYFNYRLYVTIRQGVMRFLNNARGIPGEEALDKEKESKISLTPEFQIVFNHFLKDVNRDLALARVLNVSQVDKQELGGLRRNNPNLGFGVVTNPGEFKPYLADYMEIFNRVALVESYFTAMLEDFPCGRVDVENTGNEPNRWQRYSMASGVLPFMMERFGDELDPYMKAVKKAVENGSYSVSSSSLLPSYKGFVDRMMQAILDRELDDFFSFPQGTSMRLLESFYRFQRAIPNKVNELMVLSGEMQSELFSNPYSTFHPKADEFERVRRKVRETYGVNFNFMGELTDSKKVFTYHNLIGDLNEQMISPREYLDSLRNKPKKLEAVITDVLQKLHAPDTSLKTYQSYKNSNIPGVKEKIEELERGRNLSVYTRQEVLEILKEIGIQEIIDLRKQDFYWEDFSQEKELVE